MSASHLDRRIAEAVDPEGMRIGEGEWRIERAWPDGNGGATVEARSPAEDSVRSGTLSSGTLSSGTLSNGTLRRRASGEAIVHLRAIGEDPRLPALAGLARGGNVVSHRAGRRAVVKRTDAFVKVVRPGRAGAVRAAHDRALACGFGEGFALAEAVPDAAAEAEGALRFSILAGRTLHDLGADTALTDAGFERAWRAWGAGWSQLLRFRRTPADLAVHSSVDEAGVIATWAGHAERLLPERAVRLRAAAARVTADLIAAPHQPLVASHRDLHDKQVLFAAGRGAGILDLDTVSRAEAALDLGNLHAHLTFRARQGHLSDTRLRIAQTVVREVADEHAVAPSRFAAYEAATAFRLGCLYLYRPAWRSLAEDWLTDLGA